MDWASTTKVGCNSISAMEASIGPSAQLAGSVLAHRQWHHVVGTWDGTTKSLWLDGKVVAQEAFAGPVQAGAAPLWLGACGHDTPAVNILDGDLAMPVIYERRSHPMKSPRVFAIRGSRRPPALACSHAGR